MEIDVKHYEDMVKGPGKFEGEPPETAYYWEQVTNGDGEDVYEEPPEDLSEEDLKYWEIEGGPLLYTSFTVNAEEAEAFDLPIGAEFRVYQSDQGFVYGGMIEDG